MFILRNENYPRTWITDIMLNENYPKPYLKRNWAHEPHVFHLINHVFQSTN